MSKSILSPVTRFPGSVTIPNPLTFPQYIAWKRTTQNLLAAFEKAHEGEPEPEEGDKPSLKLWEVGGVDEYTLLAIPGICEVVEKWDLAGFPPDPTPDTFPATPRVAVARLIYWLVSEIDAVAYQGDDDPNG